MLIGLQLKLEEDKSPTSTISLMFFHFGSTTKTSMEPETEHILMLPFMAQGHLRPFLELAQCLHARTSFTITILTTTLNAQFLRQKLNSATNTIQVAELPFDGSDHGLPPNVESLEKLPITHFISLFHASTSLEPHLRDFISVHFTLRRPPLCIIFDHLMGWVAPVAKSFGSFGVSFTTMGAYGTASYLSLWANLPHRNVSDDQYFSLPGFPSDHLFHRSQVHRIIRFADGSDDWSRYFQPQLNLLNKASGWLCNSVEEIEPLGFEIFRNYVKLPVWAIGPMVPLESSKSSSSSDDDKKCIQWLSERKSDSVLYISFGSQNTISPTQMMELATGLELSKKPFLWVIRPPIGFDINGEFLPEWLPEGFEERVREKKQGKLVHKWGPQLEILSHKSTAAFLSHCGWNSVLEGLNQGVPLIGWPLAAEQAFNSKMLTEEMGVAIELTRGLEGEVKKEEVKRVLEVVLDRGEGSRGLEMKKKAVQVTERLRDAVKEEGEYKGSSVRAMDDFVDSILSFREMSGSPHISPTLKHEKD